MKYLWTAALIIVEPFVTLTYWCAYRMHTFETFLAIKAGEPQDE
jgi:hypothetical protein